MADWFKNIVSGFGLMDWVILIVVGLLFLLLLLKKGKPNIQKQSTFLKHQTRFPQNIKLSLFQGLPKKKEGLKKYNCKHFGNKSCNLSKRMVNYKH